MASRKPAPKSSIPALSVVERVILFVRDVDRTARWYADTLGIPVRHRERGWAELDTRGVILCLHGGRSAPPPKDPPQIGFRVENFDAAYRALQLREVSNLSDPLTPCPGIRVAHFSDPDGHMIGIEGP
jgi:catechol 2,3-dioxygenase-like lactoylglutathione lyase family enzyme